MVFPSEKITTIFSASTCAGEKVCFCAALCRTNPPRPARSFILHLSACLPIRVHPRFLPFAKRTHQRANVRQPLSDEQHAGFFEDFLQRAEEFGGGGAIDD